ncbi:MAG: GDYXXLXY domain-containing protein [Helicobacteraceae bacterium]|jgi:uncharacterized membrane-anchored protein|nr:GDYXXLXY domain-containing protein [Helicobacteraceae bacterium]
MREFFQQRQRKIVLAALGIIIALQLFACFYQIFRYESTLAFGKPVVLSMRTYDPFDAFRGRYARLNVSGDSLRTDKQLCATYCGRQFFVTYKAKLNDRNLSVIDDAFIDEPQTDLVYLKLRGEYNPNSKIVELYYDFDRFYMQEDLAKEVDRDRGLLTGDRDARLVVRALNGKGVIENVMIGGQTLSDYLRERKKGE